MCVMTGTGGGGEGGQEKGAEEGELQRSGEGGGELGPSTQLPRSQLSRIRVDRNSHESLPGVVQCHS